MQKNTTRVHNEQQKQINHQILYIQIISFLYMQTMSTDSIVSRNGFANRTTFHLQTINL